MATIKLGDIFNMVDTTGGTKFIIKNHSLFNLVKKSGGFKKDAKWQQ